MLLERLGKELLFFDGGMGTLLQAEGLQPGELPETWNIERKETRGNGEHPAGQRRFRHCAKAQGCGCDPLGLSVPDRKSVV